MRLVQTLDLQEYIAQFSAFLAREKSFIPQGDRQILSHLIQELEVLDLKAPMRVKDLSSELASLQKFGILNLNEIFEFVKIIRYFSYLKKSFTPNSKHLFAWLQTFHIPQALLEISDCFEDNAKLKYGIFAQIDSMHLALKTLKAEIQLALSNAKENPKLQSYLVDSQVHFIEQNQCLLLKAGFHNVIKGIVLARSQSGFFYVLPQNVADLKTHLSILYDRLQTLILEVCSDFSRTFNKYFLFLRYIDKEFDKFDHLYARVAFAKASGLEFIYQLESQGAIILDNFSHPALKNPTPISISLDKTITFITGVNAGGKTMLLKSILSACFLSKYLLPLRLNPHKSRLLSFKNIFSIISDPQNSKNDISTFAGRMLGFSEVLEKDHFLLGIDEIELGTDSDEAASLYKVLLEFLSKKDCRIVVTTHHKRLSALMAHRSDVGLIAALYDEKNMRPIFRFLEGSIGKSYAFEVAQTYGIPQALIAKAKKIYGEDKERLNELITRSSALELELQERIAAYNVKIDALDSQKMELQNTQTLLQKEFENKTLALQSHYNQALNELKTVMKENDNKQIHKALNNAHKILQGKPTQAPQDSLNTELCVGDCVKFGNTQGIISSLDAKFCTIQTQSNKRLKVPRVKLQKIPQLLQTTYLQAKPRRFNNSAHVKLDLHGKRIEEALEELEVFLSNALIAGFDEVLVFHGIGTGKLSAAVAEFLKTHPKVLSFEHAPADSGGFGAKIIRL